MDYGLMLKSFGAFFAVMNPFVNLPIFLSLTSDYSQRQQRLLASKIVVFSAIMCAVILIAGQHILAFFGVTVEEFRVAGGLVLAHIAWSMLNGNDSAAHHGTQDEKQGLAALKAMAFYPMTFPMIVGPGTIATIIVYTGGDMSLMHLSSIAVVLAVVLGLLFLVLHFSAFFSQVMTQMMRVIMTRLMGMILLVIAIDMIFAGTKSLLPGLA